MKETAMEKARKDEAERDWEKYDVNSPYGGAEKLHIDPGQGSWAESEPGEYREQTKGSSDN